MKLYEVVIRRGYDVSINDYEAERVENFTLHKDTPMYHILGGTILGNEYIEESSFYLGISGGESIVSMEFGPDKSEKGLYRVEVTHIIGDDKDEVLRHAGLKAVQSMREGVNIAKALFGTDMSDTNKKYLRNWVQDLLRSIAGE